jgi:hypothetical protein
MVRLSDVFGRTLQTFLLRPDAKVIDISGIPSGVYYLQGTEKNTLVRSPGRFFAKLIKQ